MKGREIPKIFPLELHLAYFPELKGSFILSEDFKYLTRKNLTVTCPKGMRTDLASIPRAMRWLFKGHNKYTYGAIPHDFLYSSLGRFEGEEGLLHTFSRKQCDRVLYEACLDAGVPKWKAWSIYSGVRVGGWAAWNSCKNKRK